MGTNFYLHPRADCECCGRPFEPLHIGKSSSGWCFSLHVIPEDGINSLDEWRERWSRRSAFIRNEYGDTVTAEQMESTITERGYSKPESWGETTWNLFVQDSWFSRFGRYPDEEDFHRHNHSERGPNLLLRHRIDGRHCIGHGPGTYDYITGEFS
jgi:hypothetical protein